MRTAQRVGAALDLRRGCLPALAFTLALVTPPGARGQSTDLTGTVVDSLTNEVLPNVLVERLLRYCAHRRWVSRPPFALERIEANGYGATAGERIVYRLPHPAPDGTTALSLTPLEFLERLALLIHPPRIHRHRYHGVLAPNAKLRDQVIALGREQGSVEGSPSGQLGAQSAAGSSDPATPGRPTSSRWAALIARIYDVLPLVCPSCGGFMSIIAFVTDPTPVRSILTCLDLPTRPPPLSPARAPRAPREAWSGIFAFDQTDGFDRSDPEPIPEFEFDQSMPD